MNKFEFLSGFNGKCVLVPIEKDNQTHKPRTGGGELVSKIKPKLKETSLCGSYHKLW